MPANGRWDLIRRLKLSLLPLRLSYVCLGRDLAAFKTNCLRSPQFIVHTVLHLYISNQEWNVAFQSVINLSSVFPLKAGPSLLIITNPDSQQLLVEPSLTPYMVQQPKEELNCDVHSFWFWCFGESNERRRGSNSFPSVDITPAELTPCLQKQLNMRSVYSSEAITQD